MADANLTGAEYNAEAHQAALVALQRVHELRQAIFGSGALFLMHSALLDDQESAEAHAEFIERVIGAAHAAGLRHRGFRALITRYADETRTQWRTVTTRARQPSPEARPSLEDTRTEAAIKAHIRAIYDPLIERMCGLPACVAKATGALLFDILGELPPIGEGWTAYPNVLDVLASEHDFGLQRAYLRNALLNDDVGDPARGWETEWAVGWLRYAERNEQRNARQLIEGNCADLETELHQGAQSVWPASFGGQHAPALLVELKKFWLCSFSHSLRARVEQSAGLLIRHALTWQRPDGSWPSHDPKAPEIGVVTTAFAVGCMQRYGDGAEWAGHITRSMQWLLSNVNEGGGWGPPLRLPGSTSSLHIPTTIAVLDAARVEGVALEHPAVAAAEAVLMRDQHPTGLWMDHRGRAEVYLTAMVLAYFRRRDQRLSTMHESISLGRGLLLKAQALKTKQYATDQVLALVSLFHGVEYTVYGFLEANGEQFRDAQGRTIGFDAALTSFRALARAKGWIGVNANLPYITQLQDLKARRDEVIHRLHLVPAEAVSRFTEAAWGFVSKFDLRVLGFTLLD